MKKFTSLFMAIIMLFALVGFADASQKHFVANVYRSTLKEPAAVTGSLSELNVIYTGITYKVLVSGSNTAETLLTSNGFSAATSSKTNPVTTAVYLADGNGTNGQIDFVCDPQASDNISVDLIVVDTAGGYTAFIHNFTSRNRTIVINEEPGIVHEGVIWFGGATTATATGITFAPLTAIHNVVAEVVTPESTKLLNVGTASNATCFRNGVLMTTAGLIQDTAVITAGASIAYYPVTTYGASLATAITGTGAGSSTGGITRFDDYVTTVGTNDTLSYTGNGTTMAGYIHFWFSRLR